MVESFVKIFRFYAVVAFSLCLFSLSFYVPAYAVNIFADGNVRNYQDLNNPNDNYFGGSDVPNGGANPVQSTFMTFTVRNAAQNVVQGIIGGSLAGAGFPAEVTGDVTLNVSHTKGQTLIGGGMTTAVNAPSVVKGTVKIRLVNSEFDSVAGGGTDEPVGSNNFEASVGAVEMQITKSKVANLLGSGVCQGLATDGDKSVLGDVNIVVQDNSQIKYIFGTSPTADNTHIGGNLNISVLSGSIVEVLACVGRGLVFGDINVVIDGPGTNVDNTLSIANMVSIPGVASVDIRNQSHVGKLFLGTDFDVSVIDINTVKVFVSSGASVDAFRIGCAALGTANSVTLDVTNNGSVGRVYMHSGAAGMTGSNAVLGSVLVNVDSGGNIGSLELCPNRGSSNHSKLTLKDGKINELRLGNAAGDGGVLLNAELELSGGLIEEIKFLPGLQASTLTFLPGSASSISSIQGNGRFGGINSQKTSRTSWGRANQTFNIGGDVIDLGGIIEVAPGGTIYLTVGKNLIVNNPKLIIQDTAYNRTTPFIIFNGLPGSLAIVNDPIDIDLSLSPGYLQKDRVLLATATAPLARPDIFEKVNFVGLVWSKIFFENNSWYLSGFKVSRDYYGFSSAAMATSWLRQQHLDVTQNRSRQALLDSHDGFWADVRGGQEKIGVSVGESKMPWFMFSAGYDRNSRMGEKWSAIYGVALGGDVARNQWSDLNKVQSTINTGIVSGYVGIGADSGFYGLATVQLSMGGIKTDAPGFLLKKSWTEFTPSESLEFGWRFGRKDAFSVTPRAQIILEHMPKRKISFSYMTDSEEIMLDGSTALTGVFGAEASYVAASYPLKVYGAIDWIKGMSGDFGVSSQFFNKKLFDEKNDNSAVRLTLGGGYEINEKMNISASVFGDLGDNKGVGVQADFSYKF